MDCTSFDDPVPIERCYNAGICLCDYHGRRYYKLSKNYEALARFLYKNRDTGRRVQADKGYVVALYASVTVPDQVAH